MEEKNEYSQPMEKKMNILNQWKKNEYSQTNGKKMNILNQWREKT